MLQPEWTRKEGTQWRQANILDSNCYCYNREGEFLFGWIALWKSIYVGNRISWSLMVCCFSFDSSRQKQVCAWIIHVNYTLINISICYLQCYICKRSLLLLQLILFSDFFDLLIEFYREAWLGQNNYKIPRSLAARRKMLDIVWIVGCCLLLKTFNGLSFSFDLSFSLTHSFSQVCEFEKDKGTVVKLNYTTLNKTSTSKGAWKYRLPPF